MKVLKTRAIAAYPKSTGANTQYWEIEAADRAYIFEFMVRYLANMSEVCTMDADMSRDWFRRRPGVWPKGRGGPNSDASITGGVVDQLLKGNDLTTVQLDAVERLFDSIANYYSEEGAVAIRFERKIFRIE